MGDVSHLPINSTARPDRPHEVAFPKGITLSLTQVGYVFTGLPPGESVITETLREFQEAIVVLPTLDIQYTKTALNLVRLHAGR